MNLRQNRQEALRSRMLTLVIGAVLISGAIFVGWRNYGDNLWENLYMEFISIVITILIIDVLNRWRDERNSEHALIQQLELAIRSKVGEVATRAVEDLRNLGLLHGADSLFSKKRGYDLSGIKITQVDLNGVNLEHVNLTGSEITNADLSAAKFTHANLHSGKLTGSVLIGADLSYADLSAAKLLNVDFTGANLTHANLQGANLYEACLLNAKLDHAKFDYETILPSAQRAGALFTECYEEGETDMNRYTNPNHPDYFETSIAKRNQKV